MSESQPSDAHAVRATAERAADHAAIDRLTAELLPALIAKLGATGLGELEVREGAWRVRLRRAGDVPKSISGSSGSSRERRPGERGSGSAERGSDRAARASHHLPVPVPATTARSEGRNVATSPAVGIFRPRTDLSAGARVRSGDRLGAVDILGVAQDVLAPMDGIVGDRLAEPGEAVEYGQELVVIEFGPVPMSTNGLNRTDG